MKAKLNRVNTYYVNYEFIKRTSLSLTSVAVRVIESPLEAEAAVSMFRLKTIKAASSEYRSPPAKSLLPAGNSALQRYTPKSSAVVGERTNSED